MSHYLTRISSAGYQLVQGTVTWSRECVSSVAGRVAHSKLGRWLLRCSDYVLSGCHAAIAKVSESRMGVSQQWPKCNSIVKSNHIINMLSLSLSLSLSLPLSLSLSQRVILFISGPVVIITIYCARLLWM